MKNSRKIKNFPGCSPCLSSFFIRIARRNSNYSWHQHHTEVERSSHADAYATPDAEAGEDLTDLEREWAARRRKGEGRGGGPAAGRHAGAWRRRRKRRGRSDSMSIQWKGSWTRCGGSDTVGKVDQFMFVWPAVQSIFARLVGLLICRATSDVAVGRFGYKP